MVVREPPRPSGRVVAEEPSLHVIRVPPRPSGRVTQFCARAVLPIRQDSGLFRGQGPGSGPWGVLLGERMGVREESTCG